MINKQNTGMNKTNKWTNSKMENNLSIEFGDGNKNRAHRAHGQHFQIKQKKT